MCSGAIWETVGSSEGAELCDRPAVPGLGNELADAGQSVHECSPKARCLVA